MALIVTKGYLINRQDYDVFDEILTFINEFGNRFVCFAPGVRRITSKNARSLIYGNFLEFEFFYSKNKMSKLKKVTTISSVDFKYSCTVAMNTINELLSYVSRMNSALYSFYQEILAEIMLEKDDYLISCYAFIKFIKITNLRFETTKCTKCSSEFDLITLSFTHHGFICQNCISFQPQFSKEELKFVKDILDDNNLISLDKIISKYYSIKWPQFYNKLHYEWNAYKKSLIKKEKDRGI